MATHFRVGAKCGALHHFPTELVRLIASHVDYEPRGENGRGFLAMLGFD